MRDPALPRLHRSFSYVKEGMRRCRRFRPRLREAEEIRRRARGQLGPQMFDLEIELPRRHLHPRAITHRSDSAPIERIASRFGLLEDRPEIVVDRRNRRGVLSKPP
jgi:hypothetical protein